MSIQQKQLNIGLFGFGVVGEALYKVLNTTTSLNATIRKVCIKHADKKRNAPKELFTTDPEVLLNDDSINVIVELIDDADAARHITERAIVSGRAVVSANKKMIAENFSELLVLLKKYRTPFLYEAACCASIPVIRNLEEYYDNDLLQSLQGIVNGSTNYILTRIAEEGLSFENALKCAQDAGFAESNPTLDIEGIDAVNKLTLLLTHAYGLIKPPGEIVCNGIEKLHEDDARFAREKLYQVKLVAQARKLSDGKIAAFVLPQFVKKQSLLADVRNEYNGVIIESSLAEEQFFYGKGAGGFATASAVLSDLSALRYGYRYEYKKLYRERQTELTEDFFLKVYVSFDGLFLVPHELFERIDEWNSNEKRCSISGIIHFTRLKNNWWKQKNTSLIVYPDAIIEGNETGEKAYSKRVLEKELFY